MYENGTTQFMHTHYNYYPAHACTATCKAVGLSCLLSIIISMKIARSRDLGIIATPKHNYLSKSSKNMLILCFKLFGKAHKHRLLGTPINHGLLMHVHKGKGYQQPHTCFCSFPTAAGCRSSARGMCSIEL